MGEREIYREREAMGEFLSSASAITDEHQKIKRYKLILSSILSSNDLLQAKKFIDHILSDAVPLVVSRQLLQSLAQELERLELETQKEIAEFTLTQIQPRVVSFKEQELVFRDKLAGLYESGKRSKASQMLSGIDLDSGMSSRSGCFNPVDKKPNIEELQRQAYYDVLFAFSAEDSPAIPSAHDLIIQDLQKEWKISDQTHTRFQHKIRESRGFPASDTSSRRVSSESLVQKRANTRKLQEKAYYSVYSSIIEDEDMGAVKAGTKILKRLKAAWKISVETHISFEKEVLAGLIQGQSSRSGCFNPVDKKPNIEELQRQAYYDVLFAFSAEDSPAIPSAHDLIIQDLQKEWKISDQTHTRFQHKIRESRGFPASDTSSGRVSSESLVQKRANTRKLQEKAYYSVYSSIIEDEDMGAVKAGTKILKRLKAAWKISVETHISFEKEVLQDQRSVSKDSDKLQDDKIPAEDIVRHDEHPGSPQHVNALLNQEDLIHPQPVPLKKRNELRM